MRRNFRQVLLFCALSYSLNSFAMDSTKHSLNPLSLTKQDFIDFDKNIADMNVILEDMKLELVEDLTFSDDVANLRIVSKTMKNFPEIVDRVVYDAFIDGDTQTLELYRVEFQYDLRTLKNMKGYSILHLAIAHKMIEMTNYLLDLGIFDLNDKNNDDYLSPLEVAYNLSDDTEFERLASFLLANGANPNFSALQKFNVKERERAKTTKRERAQSAPDPKPVRHIRVYNRQIK